MSVELQRRLALRLQGKSLRLMGHAFPSPVRRILHVAVPSSKQRPLYTPGRSSSTRATLPELMKIVREDKGDVALKKGLQRAEYVGPETERHVPSDEEIFPGAEEPIDVEAQPTSTALTRTGAGPVAPYRGGPGMLTEEQPTILRHERLAAGQLPGSLAGTQKLL